QTASHGFLLHLYRWSAMASDGADAVGDINAVWCGRVQGGHACGGTRGRAEQGGAIACDCSVTGSLGRPMCTRGAIIGSCPALERPWLLASLEEGGVAASNARPRVIGPHRPASVPRAGSVPGLLACRSRPPGWPRRTPGPTPRWG